MLPRRLVVVVLIAFAALAAWGTSAALLHFMEERRMWLRYTAAGTVGYVVLVATLTFLFGRMWRADQQLPQLRSPRKSRFSGSWDVPDVSDALSLFEDPLGCVVVLIGVAAILLGFLLFNAVGGVVELGLEAAVVGATFRRLRKHHSADWGLGLRRTVGPAALLQATISIAAALLQQRYPYASTMRDLLAQWL
jgi:hypothetical protein